MASLRVARRTLCVAAEAAATAAAPVKTTRWERFKNSRAAVWCRGLVTDYKEACKEVLVGARERPLKASVYAALLGGATACFYTKPDRASFDTHLLDRTNQLGLLSPWIRNAASDGHVQNLVKLSNEGRLHVVSLAFLSLVYRADDHPDTALYEAQCSNVSVPWREIPGRILDVGAVGRWWVLDHKMRDYDVNQDEFKSLPEHMQAAAVPSVQQVEESERLHRESWQPLKVEEEDEEEKKEAAGAVEAKEGSVSVESPAVEALKEEQSPA